MIVSSEILTKTSKETGFRQEILEKVAHLLTLLESFQTHPFLKGKFALKGGTALNLFLFDIPRLSVDIDLNYIGSEDSTVMQSERPKLEQAFQAIFSREGYSVRRKPQEHAGGKWFLRYNRANGLTGNLEVDINFMYRLPLWKISEKNSHSIGIWRSNSIPLLDIHEISAGKLAALFARKQARDLFDCHAILKMAKLNRELLRLAFVVYGAMNRRDWRSISIDEIGFDSLELKNQLVPTLRANFYDTKHNPEMYSKILTEECRHALSAILPFSDNEMDFLNLILDKGIIDPTLLSDDTALQHVIKHQPLLRWKALNVRKQLGLT